MKFEVIPPTITITGVAFCEGETGKTVTAALTDAPAGYAIKWGNANITTAAGSTATSATGTIGAGATATFTATATLEDNTGTVVATSAPYTVTINKKPVMDIKTAPFEVCSGKGMTLTATPAGLDGYKWTSEGTTVGTLAALPTGNLTAATTYTVEGTKSGCKGTKDVTVEVNPLPKITSLTADNGKSDGCVGDAFALTAAGSGGTGNLGYVWTGVTGTAAKLSPVLAADNNVYTVQSKDAKGCISADTKSITIVGHQVTLAPSADPTTVCLGGTTDLKAVPTFVPAGKQGTVTYVWDNGIATNAADVTSGVLNTVGNVIFKVKATDQYQCSDEKTVTVNVIDKPTVSITPEPAEVCSGKGITLTALPAGATYQWDQAGANLGTGQTQATGNLTATTTFNVKATIGTCSGTATKTVTVNPLPTVTLEADETDVCATTPVQLTATAGGGTPGFSYSWTGAGASGTLATMSPNVPAGEQTYEVTVEDSKKCVVKKEIIITGHQVEVTVAGRNVCAGDAASLVAVATFTPDASKGEVSYLWTPAADIANGGTTANATSIVYARTDIGVTKSFHVVVTDGNGCKAETDASFPITDCAGAVVVVNNTPTAEGCLNADISLSVTASGGPSTVYTYDWTLPAGLTLASAGTTTDPTAKVTAAVAGTYTVTVVVHSGDKESAPVTMVVTVKDCSTPLAVVNNTPTAEGCLNTDISLSVTASGGPTTAYTYDWTLPAGLTLASAGTTADPTAKVKAAVAGTYTVTVVVHSGVQTKTETMVVTVKDCSAPVVASLTMTVDKKCANPGEELTITITGVGGADDYTFTLKDQSNNTVYTKTKENGPWTHKVIATTAGTYKITDFSYTMAGVVTAGTPPASVSATFDPLPDVSVAGAVNNIINSCQGELLTLNGASGDAQAPGYTWDKGVGNGVPFLPTAGNYTVTATNALGCRNTAVVTVAMNPKPSVNVPLQMEICLGESVTLTATSPEGAVCTWDQGVVNNVPFKPLQTATYEATATAASGCTAKKTTLVVVNQPPVIVRTSRNPRNIAIGKDVFFALTATGNHLTYQWFRKMNQTWSPLADGSNSFPVIAGTKTDSLRLKAVPVEWDASEFKCVVTGDCGKDSVEFQLTVKECFTIETNLVMGEGITPNTEVGSVIHGWYCIGTRIALHAVVTSPEGYDIEGAHYKWTIDGLDLPEEHKFLETDTAVLSWIPEYHEDDIVVKVCAYSDGACEEICSRYLRLKARPFADARVAIQTSVDPEHAFCPGDEVDFWVAAKGQGMAPRYHWRYDINDTIAEKFTLKMEDKDIRLCVTMLPSPDVCVNHLVADTVFLTVKDRVHPTLHIENSIGDTIACRGDKILFQAVFTNAGEYPQLEWFNDIWAMGNEQFAEAELKDKDMWIRCNLMPGNDVCYDGHALTDTMVIRLVENGSVTITSDMAGKEEGDELLFESEVKNLVTDNRIYEWFVNAYMAPEYRDIFTSSSLKQGDSVVLAVSGLKICQLRVFSNKIVVDYGNLRDTAVVIYKDERIQSMKLAKAGDAGKTFRIIEKAMDGNCGMLPDGRFNYTPNMGFVGMDQVKYVVVDKNGRTEDGYIYIEVQDNARFRIPNLITPNGDGMNDTWVLEFLKDYPDHLVTVYDRNGVVVFQANHYQNDWDGTGLTKGGYVASVNLVNGIYTYVIDLKDKAKTQLKSWMEIRADLNRKKLR